jgi:hypothetical protein
MPSDRIGQCCTLAFRPVLDTREYRADGTTALLNGFCRMFAQANGPQVEPEPVKTSDRLNDRVVEHSSAIEKTSRDKERRVEP